MLSPTTSRGAPQAFFCLLSPNKYLRQCSPAIQRHIRPIITPPLCSFHSACFFLILIVEVNHAYSPDEDHKNRYYDCYHTICFPVYSCSLPAKAPSAMLTMTPVWLMSQPTDSSYLRIPMTTAILSPYIWRCPSATYPTPSSTQKYILKIIIQTLSQVRMLRITFRNMEYKEYEIL